ncbi:hypothetical protein AWM79_23975 [Pseudomonas agarici]|uniref:Uncharacterized protein n=2 Tax=Pseudomonas agarici TaxID=46677 RepID=A0A0X1T7P5_PSEAA|nr:hypothetical protein AWM79_23975 [Pseudomonas agarici]SEL58078.1 hypothetical protein SAMN05216604_12311 [Pseudomonas agarici]
MTAATINSYIELLNEMRAHHKKCVREESATKTTPSEHLRSLHASAIKGGQKELTEPSVVLLQASAKGKGGAHAEDSQRGLTVATTEFKNSGSSNVDEYKKKLDKLREKDKKNAEEHIDKMYDEAIVEIENHPESASAVVGFMEAFGGKFNEVLNTVKTFIMDLAKNIMKWVGEVFSKIKDTFNKVVGFISGWF